MKYRAEKKNLTDESLRQSDYHDNTLIKQSLSELMMTQIFASVTSLTEDSNVSLRAAALTQLNSDSLTEDSTVSVRVSALTQLRLSELKIHQETVVKCLSSTLTAAENITEYISLMRDSNAFLRVTALTQSAVRRKMSEISDYSEKIQNS